MFGKFTIICMVTTTSLRGKIEDFLNWNSTLQANIKYYTARRLNKKPDKLRRGRVLPKEMTTGVKGMTHAYRK